MVKYDMTGEAYIYLKSVEDELKKSERDRDELRERCAKLEIESDNSARRGPKSALYILSVKQEKELKELREQCSEYQVKLSVLDHDTRGEIYELRVALWESCDDLDDLYTHLHGPPENSGYQRINRYAKIAGTRPLGKRICPDCNKIQMQIKCEHCKAKTGSTEDTEKPGGVKNVVVD